MKKITKTASEWEGPIDSPTGPYMWQEQGDYGVSYELESDNNGMYGWEVITSDTSVPEVVVEGTEPTVDEAKAEAERAFEDVCSHIANKIALDWAGQFDPDGAYEYKEEGPIQAFCGIDPNEYGTYSWEVWNLDIDDGVGGEESTQEEAKAKANEAFDRMVKGGKRLKKKADWREYDYVSSDGETAMIYGEDGSGWNLEIVDAEGDLAEFYEDLGSKADALAELQAYGAGSFREAKKAGKMKKKAFSMLPNNLIEDIKNDLREMKDLHDDEQAAKDSVEDLIMYWFDDHDVDLWEIAPEYYDSWEMNKAIRGDVAEDVIDEIDDWSEFVNDEEEE